MLEERFVLKDSMGLHARPAAQLMMALKDIQSAVTISGNGEQVDGKDEEKAMEAVRRVMKELDC